MTSLTNPRNEATELSKRTHAASTCEASTCFVRSGENHSAARESSVFAGDLPLPEAAVGASFGSHIQNTKPSIEYSPLPRRWARRTRRALSASGSSRVRCGSESSRRLQTCQRMRQPGAKLFNARVQRRPTYSRSTAARHSNGAPLRRAPVRSSPRLVMTTPLSTNPSHGSWRCSGAATRFVMLPHP